MGLEGLGSTGLATIRGVVERHLIVLEKKLTEFRKRGFAILAALNKNGFEPRMCAGPASAGE